MGKKRVMMVSDFFYPGMGGVEIHIYSLAQRLMSRGHKVIIVTHADFASGRVGVRWLSRGLKVYYVPLFVFFRGNSFPTTWWTIPLFLQIVRRERIDLMHGHQAFSSLAHEWLTWGAAYGMPTVFTDHSLFGFNDVISINVNKLLQFTSGHIDHAICVSHTSRENTVVRSTGALRPEDISVIPNAVDTERFYPRPPWGQGPADTSGRIVVVVMSRLVYRKGIDLLVDVIPQLCAERPDVDFLIGGDGDKRPILERMLDEHCLHDRVSLIGAVPAQDVPEVLRCGHIFLNTSLTESFCMAIVEGAACGLDVVTTDVGGVPEVLPPELFHLCRPEPEDLLRGLKEALDSYFLASPSRRHATVAQSYSWNDIAERTERVYTKVQAMPRRTFTEKVERQLRCGLYAGLYFCGCLIFAALLLDFYNWFWPQNWFDVAPEWGDTYDDLFSVKVADGVNGGGPSSPERNGGPRPSRAATPPRRTRAPR